MTHETPGFKAGEDNRSIAGVIENAPALDALAEKLRKQESKKRKSPKPPKSPKGDDDASLEKSDKPKRVRGKGSRQNPPAAEPEKTDDSASGPSENLGPILKPDEEAMIDKATESLISPAKTGPEREPEKAREQIPSLESAESVKVPLVGKLVPGKIFGINVDDQKVIVRTVDLDGGAHLNYFTFNEMRRANPGIALPTERPKKEFFHRLKQFGRGENSDTWKVLGRNGNKVFIGGLDNDGRTVVLTKDYSELQANNTDLPALESLDVIEAPQPIKPTPKKPRPVIGGKPRPTKPNPYLESNRYPENKPEEPILEDRARAIEAARKKLDVASVEKPQPRAESGSVSASTPIAPEDVAPLLEPEELEDDKAKERDFTELDRIKDMAEFLRYEKYPSPAQLAREFGISRHSSQEVFRQVMAYLEAEKAATNKTTEAGAPVDVVGTPEESVSAPEKISNDADKHKEQYNAFKSAVESVQNLEQLEQVIKTIPGITGSREYFTQSELLQVMQSIIKGESPIYAMTRSGGLRFKLEALIKAQTTESVDVPAPASEPEPAPALELAPEPTPTPVPAPVEQPKNSDAQAIQNHLEEMKRKHGEIPVAVEPAEEKVSTEVLPEPVQRNTTYIPEPSADRIPPGTFDSKVPASEVPYEEMRFGFKKMWKFLTKDAGSRQTPEKKPEPLPAYEFKPHDSAALPNLDYLKASAGLREKELISQLKEAKTADDIYDALKWNNGLYGYEFENSENRPQLMADKRRKERVFTADEVAHQIENYVLGNNTTLTFPDKYGLHQIAQEWKTKRENTLPRRVARSWRNRGEK